MERGDPQREERRAVRRHRRARPRAAELGRSRSGLTSKVHLAVERRRRPLSIVPTPGQAADRPRFIPVLEKIQVRGRAGRPRTRPDAVADDKAYSSRANRAQHPHRPARPGEGVRTQRRRRREQLSVPCRCAGRSTFLRRRNPARRADRHSSTSSTAWRSLRVGRSVTRP
ncbi:transposase [Streptomyces sp. NPDC020490]|uniref:transposase n=1 Tax=Streptomyces sp. NPDC020490 TaxID=3365078 RepID=UPI0037B4F472